MRTLKRNKVKVWYWMLHGEQEIVRDGLRTGQFQKVYEAPKLLMANVAPATGNADIEPFGTETEYSHIMAVEGKTEITEETILWIGNDPSEARDKFYRVVRIAESLNHTRIAIRETEYTTPNTGEDNGSNDNGDGT